MFYQIYTSLIKMNWTLPMNSPKLKMQMGIFCACDRMFFKLKTVSSPKSLGQICSPLTKLWLPTVEQFCILISQQWSVVTSCCDCNAGVVVQDELNTGDGAWMLLATEGDPHVLSLLLWDWLDQLKVLSLCSLCFSGTGWTSSRYVLSLLLWDWLDQLKVLSWTS